MSNSEESDDSDYGEDMLGMVEEDDIEFLKNAVNLRSYGILKRVKLAGNEVKSKRKKLSRDEDDDDTLEYEYEDQFEEPVRTRNLLPIKSGKGIIKRTAEVIPDLEETTEQIDDEDCTGEDEYTFASTEADVVTVPKTSTELLAVYNETIRKRKLEIGSLCTGLLENPEERVTNFKLLLQILEEYSVDAQLSVRKLVVVSLLEVFKDVLPSYQIKQQDAGGVKLKKDTLKLQKYEEALLLYYRKYLQKLEKYSSVLYKKRGDTRQHSECQIKLGELAVHAMCDLLITHPYFNYSQNIAQAVVPFLNHANPSLRQAVASACKTIFKEDKREEITLKILRVLNHYIKNRAHNMRPDMLEVLLHLPIKDVNLDVEREQEIKQRKLMSRKQNVLQLSKKEKKRKKRLQQLEQEMLETKAEESKQNKQKNLADIMKIVFGIYFRILKSSTNTKVLGASLEGLAKFSQCINLDYYVDLLNLLDRLLKQDWLGFREELHCVQTVFAILSDQGEAINLDPSRFYAALYKNLSSPKTHVHFPVVLKTLDDVLIKRRKKITNKRLIGFVKRIATLGLQLPHNGSLGCLGVIKTVLQLNKAVDVLLDLDASVGDGDYHPELDDPEYCNAASSALFELSLLGRHYHPVVCRYARHVAEGVPPSGEGSLPMQFGKMSPEQLCDEFDPGLMAFNPAVSVPKKKQPKAKQKRRVQFRDEKFRDYCKTVMRRSSKNGAFIPV